MTNHHIPRRPAMLAPQQAESIVGDSDPSVSSELAHSSAWALMGLPDAEYPREATVRIRELIAAEGIDAVAELWERSPEFTLPGALWRSYLFAEWLRCEPQQVSRRYQQGLSAYEAAAAEKGAESGVSLPGSLPGSVTPQAENLPSEAFTPQAVEHAISQLFAGEYSEDTMDTVFSQAAVLMRILATGDAAASVWISQPTDPLAYPVSTRAHALVRTAQELEKAALYAQAGELD